MTATDNDDLIPGVGRLLFAQACSFVAAAPTPRALPAPTLPEVAFAGRSNVGKSSLINALTNRKDLAHASKTPGRTRSVNIFNLGGRLHLIDLPGYGYAKAGRVEVASWSRTVDAYLADRSTLRRVCLLLDARRGPTDNDREACEHLDIISTTYQLILTKADKVKKDELDSVIEKARTDLGARPAAFPRMVTTSSRTGLGMADLRDELATLAEPEAVT
ncbi:MAG: YihA family ribosome biogenesis GTP-binding protein [Rhodospirillales bacterium]|nr:YihA family ribosome biogenesis GTP-binding protein [Rhodospirillales bacterium]